MADPPLPSHLPPPFPPSTAQTPLLDSNHHEENQSTDLDGALEWLETFLTFLGFNQSSALSLSLSWAAFVGIGVLLPILVLEFSQCSDCQKYQIKGFEIGIVVSQACLAAVSLVCLSHNLRKYGIRKFLFVDRFSGHTERLGDQYVKQIKESMRLLALWLLPCLILKTAREIIRIVYGQYGSWWLSTAILLAMVLSWTYVSTISLTASILFHLICNLQVIHFGDYAKLLERESDVLIFIEEHIRLRLHLSMISHRFRIFLLLDFLVVTASLFMTLFQTIEYSGVVNIINGGDFAVSSVVQAVGIVLCLHAATKISNRAQGIASLASRWHALATCNSTDASSLRGSNSAGNLEAFNNSFYRSYSESDLESVDYLTMPTNTQSTNLSSYHRRQAFVSYLQTNPGGITLYGWKVDRELINTIFFIELSLVTFVLGKTVVFSSGY